MCTIQRSTINYMLKYAHSFTQLLIVTESLAIPYLYAYAVDSSTYAFGHCIWKPTKKEKDFDSVPYNNSVK